MWWCHGGGVAVVAADDGDAGVGALCARTAVIGAFLNVKINTGGLKDTVEDGVTGFWTDTLMTDETELCEELPM